MKKIILFDFDGVIADTFDIAYLTAQILLPKISEEDYRKMFEGNIYESAKAKTKNLDDLNSKWFKDYAPRLLKKSIIPGITNQLEQLSKKYTLIIISSSITSPILEYTNRHHITHFFKDIYGADVETDKMKKIKMVFKKYNAKPSDCVFITDTLGDLKEAKKAGVESLAVTWGFHDIITLQKGKPKDYIRRVDDITKKIDKYFK
ncbi:HAD family hydrolase [Patescibacteria group bacterium]|nr:HAD family hydrolase [Patescibacteria group bacterium]